MCGEVDMFHKKFRSLGWTLCVMALLTSTPAHAYIDPVTGSFVIQGLIAAVMAVVAGVRSIRERVLGLFKRRRDDDLA